MTTRVRLGVERNIEYNMYMYTLITADTEPRGQMYSTILGPDATPSEAIVLSMLDELVTTAKGVSQLTKGDIEYDN